MRLPAFSLIAFLVALVVVGCGPNVRHDHRPGFDPAAAETYRVADTLELQRDFPEAYSQLVDERLREVLHDQFVALGYRRTDAGEPADLELVVRVQQRSRLRQSGGSGIGFGVGIGGGHRRSGVGVGVGSGGRAEEELLHDLIVELRGPDGALLWQGVVEDGLSEHRRTDPAELRQVVHALFDQPPFDDLVR